MKNPSRDVSVIICAHTEARWGCLVEAVSSVQAQTAPAREIIVVIDHNPTLLQRVRAELPSVRAIENREQRGAAGAKNSGVAAAHSAWVAFLDDDAVAEPDWLERLASELGDPDVIGAGGKTMPRWQARRPAWFPPEFDWVVGCTHRGMPETVAPVRNLIACNMLVRRRVFEAFGGFRHGIGPDSGRALGCEETEFCIRVGQGLPRRKWLHQPAAKVYHQVPLARATWRYFVRRCYGEGISKALIARFIGAQAGLASERQHVLQVLPASVLRDLRDLVFHFDLGGLGRAAAIALGLAVTTFGYIQGSLTTPGRGPAAPAPLLSNRLSRSDDTA